MERCGGRRCGKEWMVSGAQIKRDKDALIVYEFGGEMHLKILRYPIECIIDEFVIVNVGFIAVVQELLRGD